MSASRVEDDRSLELGAVRSTCASGPAIGAYNFLAPHGSPAFLAQSCAAAQCRQSHAERFGLGHSAEAIECPGGPAGHLDIDCSGLDATLDQLEHPECKLAVQSMKRLASKVPRQRVAQVEDPPCPACRLGRGQLGSDRLDIVTRGRGRVPGTQSIRVIPFFQGQGDAPQGRNQVLFDEVTSAPGSLRTVGQYVEHLGGDAKELPQNPARQAATAEV